MGGRQQTLAWDTPEMVWVFSRHADPQCIEDTLGVVEAERAPWKFLPHCVGLREAEENRLGFRVNKYPEKKRWNR